MAKAKLDAMQWFYMAAAKAADDAFLAFMRGSDMLFLWHKAGGLMFAVERPGPEWSLTTDKAQGGWLTRDQLRKWTVDQARNAACLPIEAR